ncbi:MAG: P-II family nitrogen regulator [Clostridiales bacterium]|nr:P-II family nitrogen regulator [Clostridiales bacterium]
MTGIYRDSGANLVMTNLARGTATAEHLSLYGLDRTGKAIISAAAGYDVMKQIFRAAKRRMFIDIPGNGIIMAVPIKSVGGGSTLAYMTDGKVSSEGVPDMNFEYELIIVILNEGYSDMVMDAARAAGAAGGTVLHAKGTAAAGTEKFFGVSLGTEKDVIYIVSNAREKAAIMKAVTGNAGTGTKAGAICFSLPVSSVAGLRRLDDD